MLVNEASHHENKKCKQEKQSKLHVPKHSGTRLNYIDGGIDTLISRWNEILNGKISLDININNFI